MYASRAVGSVINRWVEEQTQEGEGNAQGEVV